MRVFNRSTSWNQLLKEAPFTSVMIIINVTVFLLEFVFDLADISLFNLGALYGPFVVELGEYYRVITAAFLHGGFIHLGFNMIVGLYVLTAGLERLIGTKKTAAIYFISMILSSILVIIFNYQYATVGASGAIFGALGSLLYITAYRHDLLTEGERRWIVQLIIINLIFTFFGGNISIPGHLGGLVSGFLVSYLFIKREPDEIIYDSQDYWQNQNDDDQWWNN